MHPKVHTVVEAARAAGLPIEVREFPQGTRTAADAARAVGCDVAQIVKSLVFIVGGSPILAMVSGPRRLDPAKLGAVLGGGEVRRASPEEVRDWTGYAIGGTPPLGISRPLPVVTDETLLDHAEVWCAAGTPTAVWAVDPRRLVEAADARVADITED